MWAKDYIGQKSNILVKNEKIWPKICVKNVNFGAKNRFLSKNKILVKIVKNDIFLTNFHGKQF